MAERKSILITGANGLLGRSLALHLRTLHNVYAVVHNPPKNPIEDVTYYVLDFSTSWTTELLPSKIDTIFHLVQSSKFRDFPSHAEDVFKVNVDSTARLLQYAQKLNVRQFIYASSGGVYGASHNEFYENSPIIPHQQLGYYLASKLCSEVLAQNYTQFMTVIILRFFFIYGAEQKRSMLIPRLIDNVKNGHPITIQWPNGISINPIHVSDAVRALTKVLALNESMILNIAGPDIITIREIAEIAGSYLDKTPIFEYLKGKPKNLIANIDSMKSLLISPEISLRNCISEMAGNNEH